MRRQPQFDEEIATADAPESGRRKRAPRERTEAEINAARDAVLKVVAYIADESMTMDLPYELDPVTRKKINDAQRVYYAWITGHYR